MSELTLIRKGIGQAAGQRVRRPRGMEMASKQIDRPKMFGLILQLRHAVRYGLTGGTRRLRVNSRVTHSVPLRMARRLHDVTSLRAKRESVFRTKGLEISLD